MNVRYRVELNRQERDQLTSMLGGGKHAARRLKRAQILLAADAGETDEAIAANVFGGLSTVYRTKWIIEAIDVLYKWALLEPVTFTSVLTA